MADESETNTGRESEPAPGLSDKELESVAELKASSAKVIHEVIRLQGDEELDRPALSLLFSGLAAGFGISASVLAEAFLRRGLPQAPWAHLVASIGYTVGFVLVILGNLQLFTESTVTAVLPLATHPTLRNLRRLLRLWGLVFGANMLGTLVVALMMAHQLIIGADQLSAALEVSRQAVEHPAWTVFLLGIPAGFLIASVAWMLPNAQGQEFWVVVMITWLIAAGGFSHVVAGSAEAWLMWASGHASFGQAIGFIIPAGLGNIVGGSCLFAVLAHGQVRGEIIAENP